MKVLFQNRRKDLWVGGDYIQLEKTAEALRKLGVEVDISEEYVVKPEVITQYDIVHLWNFSMEWSKFQLWVARKHKKPVVCSMIYHENDQFIPYNFQQIMLDELSAQIYLTESEKKRVDRHLISNTPRYVIPNGIDNFWFKDTKLQKEDKVLTVGRIEPSKGQLAVALACNKLGVEYYCAGEVRDEEYAKQIEDAGGVLLGNLEPDKLIQWYAVCKVFALVSKAEVFPLTVMEAMAQNCQIVLTNTSEWKPDVLFADYHDENSIYKALKEAFEQEKDYQSFVKQYTWEEVAKQLLEIYKKLC